MSEPATDIAQTPPLAEPVKLSRAQGKLRISFKQRGAQTVLDEFYQQGCLKARFPASEPGHIKEGVLINTSGGLTDGDRLDQNLKWNAGTTARMTSQAAERIYRSRQQDAHIETHLDLAENARGEYLPQECILFNGGRLRRANKVTLQKGASLIATESLVFGRTAMDEEVREGSLFESWRIHYDGALIFADGFHLEGDIRQQLSHRAIADSARAMATLLYVGEDADDFEKALKRACGAASNAQARVGCSLLSNLLIIRILASDGAKVRAALGNLLQALMAQTNKTPNTPLPKVWLC